MIQIYKPSNKNFDNNGDMTLLPSKAVVKVSINKSWIAEIEHPIDAEGRWKYIQDEAVVKLNSFNGEQLFRVKKKVKSDSGVEATLEPIFFDAKNDCFLTDVRPKNVSGQQALNIMCSINSKYSGESDITSTSSAYYEYMNLLEALNGKQNNAFTNRWGAELLFDNYKVIANKKIGGDYGVELRYGKNIPRDGMVEEVDTSKVVTRIYPKSFNGHKLTSEYVDSELINNYPTVKCAEVRFEEIRLREDLQEGEDTTGMTICDNQSQLDKALIERCKEEFKRGIDKPSVSIEADMELLQNTEEYKDYKILETVSIGDVIHCVNEHLGIVTNERVIEMEYNCLLGRTMSVILGHKQDSYFNNVDSAVDKIEGVITPDGGLMADKVIGILDAMKTQLKYQKDIAKKQDVRAILFEDLDPDSPTYGAMCLGTQGFQISNRRTADGRDWDWRTAGTANGFNADTVITGKLTDKTGKNYWDLDTGDFQLAGVGGDQTNWQDKIDQAQQNAIQESAKALLEYANTVTKDFENMQKQVDGQVEDWYYDYEPTPNNAPASTWITAADKQKHEGDRFFWKSKGYAYRWMKDGSTWKWVLLKDTDITKAMQEAQDAKDIADGKRRTFITRPDPPYDIGDLWMDGTDVLTCTNPKVRGAYFDRYDWKKLNKYTDNIYVDNLVSDLEKQVDGKIQTYSQSSDPSLSWNTQEREKHLGDIWYDTTNKRTKRWNGSSWQDLKDKDAEEAGKLAQKKAQVFIDKPTIPYYKGDLWFNGSEIKTCVTTRTTGYFNSYDWEKKDGYTDDTVANEALQNSKNPVGFLTQNQVFNKLTNDGAIQGIFMRDGKLYINGEYVEADTLSAITSNLGQVNSANINNYLDGVKVFEIRENIITFFDKYESRTNGGVGPIQEYKDEYGTELWSTLFAQMVCGSNYFRVTKDWADLHCNRISVNGHGDLTKYSRMNVLWSGSYWMTNTEEAVFTEPVSSQPHGIVLVFSATSGTNTESPGDWWWNSFFVPRPFIIDHPWETYSISLTGGSDMVGYGRKMLGFHDTKIIGYEANKNVYEVAGLKYENNRFVLRYVYGV